MIDVHVKGNQVTFVADAETQEELRDAETYEKKEMIVAEALHERWSFIRPEEIGALTDSPVLATEVCYDSKGNLEYYDKVCWYPGYELRDWLVELQAGSTIFTLV